MAENNQAAQPDENVIEDVAQETATDAPGSPTSDFLSNPDVIAFIEKQVQEGVKNALKGQTPKANTAKADANQKSEFERMTNKERLELFKSNPSEYHKLAKGGL